MENVINFFYIPATDFSRAVSFYKIGPKTHISPEAGYIGMFIDTEGNKIGLHSINQ